MSTEPKKFGHLEVESLTVKGPSGTQQVAVTPDGIWVGPQGGDRFVSIQYFDGMPTVSLHDVKNGGGTGCQLALSLEPSGDPIIQVGGADGKVGFVTLEQLRKLAKNSLKASDTPLNPKSC